MGMMMQDTHRAEATYAIEMNGDGSTRVQRGRFTVQREDFAHDADGLVGELLQVVGIDTRGRFRGHGGGFVGSEGTKD